ncbi:hypothetical protein ACLOJK_022648 [Asimina triloba]
MAVGFCPDRSRPLMLGFTDQIRPCPAPVGSMDAAWIVGPDGVAEGWRLVLRVVGLILTMDGTDGSPILIVIVAWWTDDHDCSARISAMDA